MINQKLWVVTFYNAEGFLDWESIVAPTYDTAVDCCKAVIRNQWDLKKGEKLECVDFEAYQLDIAIDIKDKDYEILLKEVK